MYYSDIVFIHWECDEHIETILKQIQKSGKKAGIALCMSTVPEKIEQQLINVDAVLLLTIPEPGRSGQKFDRFFDPKKMYSEISRISGFP